MIAIPDVLTPEELSTIREFLSTATFADGKLTAGAAIQDRKQNEQVSREQGGPLPIDSFIGAGLRRSVLFQEWARPLRIVAPIFNRYTAGMHYGNHVDEPVIRVNPPMRADISITVFLSNPDEYTGGELVVESAGGPRAVKLTAGHAFAYLNNALHRVNAVTAGERFAAALWVQSQIPDDRLRAIIFDLSAVREAIAPKVKGSAELDLLTKAHQNLVRLGSSV